jgi:uncharacterized protein (DUF488 family)
MPIIATIGYEAVTLDAFLDTLVQAEIKQILDVRELPLSRKKGFSKKSLGLALAEIGIGYVHLRSLGDPKPGRLAARAGRDAEFRRIFGQHMRTDAAQTGLAECAELATNKRSALLCFERKPNCCHRTIVADALRLGYAFSIEHLDPMRLFDEQASERRGGCSCEGNPTGWL